MLARRLLFPSPQARTLLASNSGRSIASQLRQGMRSPGVLRELTRCLANLWAHSAGGGAGTAGGTGGGDVQVQVVEVPAVVPLLLLRGSPGPEGGARPLQHLQVRPLRGPNKASIRAKRAHYKLGRAAPWSRTSRVR